MKVVVTGATGFIGRHVVGSLNRRGIEPFLVIQPDTRTSERLKRGGAIELDLREESDGTIFTRLGEPDLLIHLAWGGLPNYRSRHHLEEELPAHDRFLSELIHSGLQSLAVAGTCFEYGMQTGALSETMETKPDNPYGQAKDALRKRLEKMQAEYYFALTWGRFFYLYGEGQSSNSLLPQLERAVKQGDTVFDMSGGEQLRDYLPVEKAADWLVELGVSQKNNGVVNICSGEPISVARLTESWIKTNQWNISLNLGAYPYPDYEPMEFWGDREKLARCLDET